MAESRSRTMKVEAEARTYVEQNVAGVGVEVEVD